MAILRKQPDIRCYDTQDRSDGNVNRRVIPMIRFHLHPVRSRDS